MSRIGLAALWLAFVCAPGVASACGGFFCSQVPVDQSGEHILFAVEGTTVTAHIQIAYQGEAEKFSWVLPLPSEPSKIQVGTDLLFQRLRQMTDPRFMVEWQNVDGCAANNDCMFPSAAGGVDQNSPPSDPDDGGVNVIQEGEVGPFEYKVVEGAGEALFTWLNDNGYDQPESSQPIVTHYANQEYKFVAVKLIKGKASGDLQPLVLTFDSPTLACVPLRLTGIAATPDMPIWTWVLGKARAVPLNFFQVLLNAKAYPWLACDSGSYFGGGFGGPIGPGSGNNTCADAYLDLVTEAADTANGHAFVTEYAGASAIMDNQIYQEGQLKTDGLSSQETPYAFLQAMLSAGFPRNALVQELIKTWIPRPDDEALPPECQGDSSFYNMGNIENCLQYMEDGWVFDPVGFANDLQERIVKPMMEAQGLFTDFSYMTRFFTTISPDEMTKDPMFSFNPDLPDVSNQHTVKATPICAPGESSPIAVELEFGDGQKQVVEGSFPECSPFQALADPTDGQPAAAGIQVLSESGDPENISPEDVDTTEPTLDTRAPNPEQASVEQRPEATASDVISGTFGPTPEGTPTTTGAGTPGSGSSSDSSSGCTTSTTPVSGTGLMLLGGLAALLLGLRRRREFARSPVSAMIIVLGLTGFAPADAEACGGFFCSQTPVDQVGEHIAFAVEGTTVTAHIQIAYQGEADKFSWVLPLPSAPSVVNVGTEALFQRLRNVTDPRFNIQWQDNEGCKVPNECQFDMASEGGGPTAGSGGGGDVNVIDEGEVGPFEYKVVEGAGEALFTWLNDNGYDQPDSSQAIVTHYANQEYKFVAVKLIKGKAAGDLQPLVLTFESPSLACVPLRLTGIAASADMPIWTWVLGKARAVPLNFFHVLLNAKAYPWLQCAQPSGEGPWVWSNNGNFDCQGAYVDLVTEAANAANGHGFVTEYAGASSVMDNQVYQEGQLNTSSLAATSGPEAFLQEMLSSGFPRTPLVQEIIKTWIPKPAAEDLPSDCQSDQDFYAMGNIEHCLQSMPEGWSFDAAGMAADLDTRVVQPMKDAQQLFTDYSYMTRFFTTVSPDEMTKDPMFSFNGDLPDVSNEHTIKATPQCEAGSETPHAVEIEYPDGQKAVVTGSFTECGGFDSTVDVTVGEPAAAEIQILGESGGAETVPAGDVATREPELDKRAPNPQQASVEQRPEAAAQEPISGFGTSPPGSGGTTNAGTGSGSGGSSSGCTASSGSSSTTPALVLLGVIGLLGLLRRRRSALVAACLVAVVSAPGAAHACGGFFCSQVPVEQKGEQILFAVDGTTVTAHIMIAYQGEAEKFSWVLPLPSEPTIKVGSDITFQRLRAMTDPRFEIQWNNDDDCAVTNTCWAVPEADFDGDGGGDPSAGGGVNVLSEGEVGPFEFKVVEGAGEALFAWLNDNGYDQPEDAKPLVQYYANQEFKFVAVKLIKGKSSGDLQPLVVTYENPSLACVPLKLTSIAASADMPVFSWVLAEARAVPMNFFHAVLNAKAFDWLKCAFPAGEDYFWGGWGNGPGSQECQNAYWDLVTEAADAAAGHAFVTEFAGDSALMKEEIWKEGQFDLTQLHSISAPGEYLQQMISIGLPRNALTQEIIKTWIPKPDDELLSEDCKEDSQFYSTWNIDNCISAMPQDWSFDPVGMANDIDERIVTPMKDAQALFDKHSYLTRFFSTISPEEMTKDPVFSFNPDLPAVSNVHTVQAKAICEPGNPNKATAVEITYPDGSVKLVEGTLQECQPFEPLDGDYTEGEPAVADIQVLGESGQAQSVDPKSISDIEPTLDLRVPSAGQANVKAAPTGVDVDAPPSGTFSTPGQGGDPVTEIDPGTNTNPTTDPAVDPGATATDDKASSGCTASSSQPGSSLPIVLLSLLFLPLILRRTLA